MNQLIEGACRTQIKLLADRLKDYIAEKNKIRVIDTFADNLILSDLGFKTIPADRGRPDYHSATLIKLFVYAYLNRIQSFRQLKLFTNAVVVIA